MLDENGVEYAYRDYRRQPLDEDEVRRVLTLLDVSARDVLRRRDRACRELGLTGDEDEAELIAHMARQPTLLERPIGIRDNRAVIGRPPERLLELATFTS